MLLAAAALAACGGEDEAAPPTATSSPRAPAAVIVRDGDSALPGAAPRIPVTDAPTPMDADGNVSATRDAVADDGPPGLIVVSDGSHDSLLLEWAGGPANATGWQYRQRRWENMQPAVLGAVDGHPEQRCGHAQLPGHGAAGRSRL